MEPTVIAALITAFASIVIGFISYFKKPIAQIPTKREIKYNQLVELFDPLEKLFSSRHCTDAPSMFEEIAKITYENLLIAPTEFLELIEQTGKKSTITDSEITLLHNEISAHYHSRRKLFGYPYKRDHIKPRKLLLLNIEIVLDRYHYLGSLVGCAAAATIVLYVENHVAAPYVLAATCALLILSILYLLKSD